MQWHDVMLLSDTSVCLSTTPASRFQHVIIVQVPREAQRLWALVQRASNGRPLPLRVLLFSALAATFWILCSGLWHTSALLGSAYTDIFCDGGEVRHSGCQNQETYCPQLPQQS